MKKSLILAFSLLCCCPVAMAACPDLEYNGQSLREAFDFTDAHEATCEANICITEDGQPGTCHMGTFAGVSETGVTSASSSCACLGFYDERDKDEFVKRVLEGATLDEEEIHGRRRGHGGSIVGGEGGK